MRVTRRGSRLGQSGSEYMMLISVVVIGVVYAGYSFVRPFEDGVNDLGRDVKEILSTGSIGGVGRGSSGSGNGNGGSPGGPVTTTTTTTTTTTGTGTANPRTTVPGDTQAPVFPSDYPPNPVYTNTTGPTTMRGGNSG